MHIFNYFIKVYGFPKRQIVTDKIELFDPHVESVVESMRFLPEALRNILDTSTAYLVDLYVGKKTSRLSYANMFTSEEVKKRVDEYTTYLLSNSQKGILKIEYDVTDLTLLHCDMYVRAISDPLLKAFYFNLYDHYKTTNKSERDAMQTYFNFVNDSQLSSMLVRGTVTDVRTCFQYDTHLLGLVKFDPLVPDVTILKDSMDKMESLLQTARLEGNVFRYSTTMS